MLHTKEFVCFLSQVPGRELVTWNFLSDKNIFVNICVDLWDHTRVYANEVTHGGPPAAGYRLAMLE